ncbi:hypothetical protein GBA52_004593 [Prunus armeniaca]|nr:hypothetical protein GBA52_004593 [Prunus armeniaca]
MQSLHHPGGYQSPGDNQLDPCRSLHHLRVINPLGTINRIQANSYIISKLSIFSSPSIGVNPNQLDSLPIQTKVHQI